MTQTVYLRYRRYLTKHWFFYVSGTLTLLLTSATEALIPKFVQWSVDLLTKGSVPPFLEEAPADELLNKLMWLFTLTLFAAWLGRIGWRQLLARRTHVAGHEIKTEFWESIGSQPLNFLHRFPLGDLMNRGTGDWNKSRFIHGFTMVLTFDVVFFAVFALIAMFTIDWVLAAACLIVVPLLPKPIIKLSKKEYDLHQKAQIQLSYLSDLISQALSTIRLQRATATEFHWRKRLDQDAERYANKQFEVIRTGWRIFLIGTIPTLFAYGVLFSFGIYRLASGAITLGEFLAIQSYTLLLQSPLFELGSVISEWQTGFASFNRVFDILKIRSAEAGDQPSSSTSYDISIRDLNFSYDTRPILKGLNIEIPSGAIIGIKGPIGTGKSTLLHVIAGLQSYEVGSITIGEEEAKDQKRSWFSQKITMVPQTSFLFAGTIRHNLCLDKTYSDDTLWQVLKDVRLHDDVQNMPEKLDTWIGEWGINLSGGQKQRLSIARAVLTEKPILLFDDCLSAVDAKTEHHILNALKRRLTEQTIIWTAHRSSSLSLCDKVYLLKDGRLEPSIGKQINGI